MITTVLFFKELIKENLVFFLEVKVASDTAAIVKFKRKSVLEQRIKHLPMLAREIRITSTSDFSFPFLHLSNCYIVMIIGIAFFPDDIDRILTSVMSTTRQIIRSERLLLTWELGVCTICQGSEGKIFLPGNMVNTNLFCFYDC